MTNNQNAWKIVTPMLFKNKNEAIAVLTVKATSWLTSCTNTAITTGGIRAIIVKICWLKKNLWNRNSNKMVSGNNKVLTWRFFGEMHMHRTNQWHVFYLIFGRLLTRNFRSLELLCSRYLYGWFCIYFY